MWLEAAAGWDQARALTEAIAGARIVARGAKASSAVKGAGLPVWWGAPGETMEEIVEHLAGEALAGSSVAIQLFEPGHAATETLRAMAGELVEIPVYRWQMPVDPEPAIGLVRAATGGELQAVTFTSQPGVRHLFRIAEGVGLGDPLRQALNGAVVPACIGPVCAEAAREEGIERPMWPEPPRLPMMVRQLTERLGAATPA
jgi:uroporphyrinogen-III synthase